MEVNVLRGSEFVGKLFLVKTRTVVS
jgi:hypothetical protein